MVGASPPVVTRYSQSGVEAVVLQRLDDWASIRKDWDSLHRRCDRASSVLDYDWLSTWWTAYNAKDNPSGLRIVTVWRDKILIGALPLYLSFERSSLISIRCLRFMSTGEAEFEETCADYLDILCESDEAATCATSAWGAVEQLEWDRLELLNMRRDSSLMSSRPESFRTKVFDRGVCPVAILSGGFNSYLERLSASRRQHFRRLLRAAKRTGLNLELATCETLDAAFEDLIRLHQARWEALGQPGVFSAPRFVGFHRQLIGILFPKGQVILARLRWNGESIAVLYGFRVGDRFEFYQSGISLNRDSQLESPGNIAHLLLMEQLEQSGVAEYDFLRGRSPYKDRLATTMNELVGIEAWRSSVRGVISRNAGSARDFARKVRYAFAPRDRHAPDR